MSQSKLFFIRFATVLLIVPIMMIGRNDGADPGNTGGPRETTCAQALCHIGPPTQGGISIDFGSQGATYSPGTRQTWTITVNGAEAAGYGFQVSARTANGGQAGSFASVDSSTLVICQDGRVKASGASCREETPIEYPTHRMPNRTNTFTLEWTPPANDAGEITVYAAGNAANLNGQPTGDQIFLNQFRLAVPLEFRAPQTRATQPVLQAFDNSGRLSAGTWIQIFGSDFAPVTRQWRGDEFNGAQAPTSLDGVEVKVNGRNAYVSFISPTQVNAQAPTDDSVGPVEIEVVNPAGSSRTTLTKTKVSPAILEDPRWVRDGRKYVIAFFSDFTTFVGPAGLVPGVTFRPARPGETIIVFGVGCGAPGGEVIAGQRQIPLPSQVTFGSTVAQSQGFLTANAVGLCQFNATVPNLGAGDTPIEVTVDGVATGQNLFTTIQP
jgi:uncharacterized protein (TIGR03437 family)